ncbi:hypothetical protein RJT34_16110 [Clitoria ternatea]|uniref:Uncharacterized protein n=1 Tax=Clitoria ternatea TaxID=43366 RepID=A0AAN9J6L5_CLITE
MSVLRGLLFQQSCIVQLSMQIYWHIYLHHFHVYRRYSLAGWDRPSGDVQNARIEDKSVYVHMLVDTKAVNQT